MYFKGSQAEFLNFNVFFLSLKVVLLLENSANPDEVQQLAIQ